MCMSAETLFQLNEHPDDPNRWHEWADQPHNLIIHLQRLVRVSVETQHIVGGLPAALAEASTP